MGLNVLVPAVSAPITLAEMRLQCRITSTAEDALLLTYAFAAGTYIEKQTSLSLVARTMRLTLDQFSDSIALGRGPVAEVLSVSHYNGDGFLTVVDPSVYTVDTASNRTQWLVLNSGQTWPTTSGVNAVQIDYTVGYDTLPYHMHDLRVAMLLLIAHWYNQREAVSVGSTPTEVPLAVDALLQNYRWVMA